MFHILVVEDDPQCNKNVCACLQRNGYEAEGAETGLAAFDKMAATMYGLVISDIMMPKLDGFEFARAIREQDKLLPILFLTARSDFSAKSEGFRIGADDYMVKPVDMDELVLRVGRCARANIISCKRLTVGSLTLDADGLSATLDGEDIPLTVKEFNILYKLLSYPKRIHLPALSLWTGSGDWTMRLRPGG